MSRKTRNLLTISGLCVLLAACLALYFFIPKGEEKDDGTVTGDVTASKDVTVSKDVTASKDAEEITVDTIESDTIEQLEVKKKGKTSYVLIKKGDEWKLSGQEDIPLDETKVTALFSCLNPVKAAKTLEKTVDAISEYGLENPVYTVIVTAGGKKYQYDLGISVPVEGGYYGMSSGNSDSIYCFAENLVSDLDIKTNTLIVRDELPQMEEDRMVYLHVDNKKGSDFEAAVVKEEERVDSYSRWNITKPYEKPLATSTKDWSSILGYFDSLTFGNLVEYGAEKQDKYGLSSPSANITIRYFETTKDYEPKEDTAQSDSDENEVPEKYRKYHTVKLCIGNKKGESYYACQKGSHNVYLMNGDVVENMTKLNVYTAMDHCVYATLATKIKGYDVKYGNTTLSVTRTPVEGTEDSSKEKNIWTLNGKQVPDEKESDFLMPYSNAYLLEYTERADDSVKPKKKKPVLTMIYHEEKRDVTVTYYPYDGTNFYRVDKNGMNYFLVDKRSVDDVIKGFKGIEKIAD